MGEWGDALFTMYQGSLGKSNCEYMHLPALLTRNVVRLLLLGTYVTLRSSLFV